MMEAGWPLPVRSVAEEGDTEPKRLDFLVKSHQENVQLVGGSWPVYGLCCPLLVTNGTDHSLQLLGLCGRPVRAP